MKILSAENHLFLFALICCCPSKGLFIIQDEEFIPCEALSGIPPSASEQPLQTLGLALQPSLVQLGFLWKDASLRPAQHFLASLCFPLPQSHSHKCELANQVLCIGVCTHRGYFCRGQSRAAGETDCSAAFLAPMLIREIYCSNVTTRLRPLLPLVNARRDYWMI